MDELPQRLLTAGITGTVTEVLEALTAYALLNPDNTPYTWSGANKRLVALSPRLIELGIDPDLVMTYDQQLIALPGGTMLANMLTSGGVDFSDPVIRYKLKMLAANIESAVPMVTALLMIGGTDGQYWQTIGLPYLPSEDEVKTALTAIAEITAAAELANTQRELRVWLRQQTDLIDLRILSGELVDQAAVQAAWGEV